MNDVPESAQTQCERLLEHLKLGLPLIAHKTLYGYSCLRLAAGWRSTTYAPPLSHERRLGVESQEL